MGRIAKMVNVQDKTTITVLKDTREWLILLKLKIQATKKQELSQADIVRLALACLDDHQNEADLSCLIRGHRPNGAKEVFDASKNSGDIKITVARALHIGTLR
jgi:hypothetical protein